MLSISQLIQHYQYEIAHPLLGAHSHSQTYTHPSTRKISSVVPLVINTQGWVKGLGEELLHSIEVVASPSHTFKFEPESEELENDNQTPGWTSSPPRELYPPVARSRGMKTYTLTSALVSPLLARHTPSDLRILSLISYFHANLTNATWDFTKPLLAVPPYQVELSTLDSGSIKKVIMLGESSDSIHPHDLSKALDGQIVALVEEADQDPARGALFNPQESGLGKEESTYLGLALIRAIQPLPVPHTSNRNEANQGFKLHVLSPLPLEALRRANTIVRNGAVELPLCGMLDWRAPNAPDLAGTRWQEVPYLDVSGVVGVGGERRRFRRNLQRKGH